jgi:uncharacterized protein YcfJ
MKLNNPLNFGMSRPFRWIASVATVSVCANIAVAGSQIIEAPVTEVTKLIERVEERVPVETCHLQRVPVPHSKFSDGITPMLTGGLIGGAIGSELGRNSKRKSLIIGASALLGGSIGRDLYRSSHHHSSVRYRTQEVCETDYRIREYQQVTGYRVRYEYNGSVYETITDTHPGATMPLEVSVTPLR